MLNPFRELLGLLPDSPLQVASVVSVSGGVTTLQLPGGGRAQALGTAAVGAMVFFRNGAIEGVAPNLPIEVIEI